MTVEGEDQELVARAQAARALAYAPYSGYHVGAAVRGASGQIYAAGNVENASYGLTVCAERAAVFKAVSEGERKLVTVAVATENGGSPCGACRQVLREFGLAMRVLVVDSAGRTRAYTLADLLPDSFGPEDLAERET
ncbi:MAG: cytidine deaminase [Anaerolineae bacterium]|nr:cytidine deaminase [Anaerolineae bacterium]